MLGLVGVVGGLSTKAEGSRFVSVDVWPSSLVEVEDKSLGEEGVEGEGDDWLLLLDEETDERLFNLRLGDGESESGGKLAVDLRWEEVFFAARLGGVLRAGGDSCGDDVSSLVVSLWGDVSSLIS